MSENISPAQIQLGQRLAHNAPDQSQIDVHKDADRGSAIIRH